MNIDDAADNYSERYACKRGDYLKIYSGFHGGAKWMLDKAAEELQKHNGGNIDDDFIADFRDKMED